MNHLHLNSQISLFFIHVFFLLQIFFFYSHLFCFESFFFVHTLLFFIEFFDYLFSNCSLVLYNQCSLKHEMIFELEKGNHFNLFFSHPSSSFVIGIFFSLHHSFLFILFAFYLTIVIYFINSNQLKF